MHFVHLNVHSHYSRGWGLPTIEELCRAAKDLGLKYLALTDTNGLRGMPEFVQRAREMGLRPIVGSEILSCNKRALLLVKNPTGYPNLCRIISACTDQTGLDPTQALRENREGLIVLSDDFSLLRTLKHDSPEDLFVEMSPGYSMTTCRTFSRKTGIPPAATNRVYLAKREQFRNHKILRAVCLNTRLSRLTPENTCREYNFLNSPEAMGHRFPHLPEAISNTAEIAESCLVHWDFNRIIFPRFEGMTDREALDRLYRETMEGCIRRYGNITPAVRARVDHEMKIIAQKNFAHYFLVVADITGKTCRSCGRGSAAASIVSYALGITHVDPVKHNLLFKRFLNPGRKEPPDIDVDFPWDERDKVLDYVFKKYGNRKAAMVANHNTFGAKSAIREAAKVFGLTDKEISRVTRKIGPGWSLKKVRGALQDHPAMRGLEFHKPWDQILDAAVYLEDHFNHPSTHCGGLVIVPDEIQRFCPVEMSPGGLQVLQWDKDSVEDSGLVKIDILGNRSLAVIRDTLALVEKNGGPTIHYPDLNPVNDPETIRIFYEGNTFGVFYFESPATRQILAKVRSGIPFKNYLEMDHFHLNIVVTSIIRPASNHSIDAWVSRLHGEPWEPIHPLLKPVLAETLGVMVFQEQLSEAAVHLAGFDAGDADELRKTINKKDKEKRLRDFYSRFVRGARKKGVATETMEAVWQMIMGFDGYSFCKPHSASYTLVAYKSAFLKAHYPAEFMASVISNGGGYYSTFGYISEAKRMGLEILPPDINASSIEYTGRNREIRVGLMQIKDLSRKAMEDIIDERSKKGPFRSLDDFLARMGPCLHLHDMRILIKAGCFDSIAGDMQRPLLMWKVLEFLGRKEKRGEPNLFDGTDETLGSSSTLPPKRPYPKALMIDLEKKSLGFFLSRHPLELYSHILRDIDYVPAKDLPSKTGEHVTTIGWHITGKTVKAYSGEPMGFISFEDPTGIYETVFFPEAYNRFCHILNAERPYILKGKVEENRGAVTLTAKWIGFLDRRGGGLPLVHRHQRP